VAVEPAVKRAIIFVDGQNLFHAVKEAFGYTFPNYDCRRLAAAVCSARDWNLKQVRFYTGVPAGQDDPFWNHFWNAKLAQMGRQGVWTYSRPLRYHDEIVILADGTQSRQLKGREKGIDLRIALDVVRMVLDDSCDVALIFSQDQDLSELADEVRLIGRRDSRWIKLASAFPTSPRYRNRRGIAGTDWIPIDREAYDACIDPRDYRPK